MPTSQMTTLLVILPKASLMSKGTELERSLFLKYKEEFAEDFGAALEVLQESRSAQWWVKQQDFINKICTPFTGLLCLR